jgi:small subunit ribosomal protein S18
MAKSNEIKYLTAIKTEKRQKKYCRFKRYGIKHVDYKANCSPAVSPETP